MTTAPALSHRLAFDSRAAVDPGEPDTGNTQGDFVQRFVLSADRKNLRGTETVMASRLEGRQPVLFIVRASSMSRQITTDWRVRDTRSRVVFAIHGATETADRAWIEILAESGVAP